MYVTVVWEDRFLQIPPSPNPPLLLTISHPLLLSATSYGMEYPFGWFGCPGDVPSPLPDHPQPTGFGGFWRVLMLCQHCSEIDKTLVWYL